MAALAPALPLTPASSSSSLPYHLTIRFSSSLPDLDLDVPSPQTTTVLSLKNLIRERLSSRNRLRFIYQGRLLPDASALSSVVKPPPPPPSSSKSHHNSPKSSSKGKGKAGLAPVRIYINCSIGDELSPEELAEEQAAAAKPPDESNTAPSHQTGHPSSWTRPRPRGFDRLLQTGFTQSEIGTLRTQFALIRTEGFAPDAMPSPDTLRNMEDAWIDNNAGGLPSATASTEDDLNGMSNVLDVMIRAMLIGFFFPLGSLAWLLRSNVWSEKWQVFVGSGVALSLTVGIVMSLSSMNH